jgi:hypothetical protein
MMESGDPESIWNALYSLVRRKNPNRLNTVGDSTPWPGGSSDHLSLDDIDSDIAQEVFLRLIIGDRLSYFLANDYTSEQIESELTLNELAAVLISRTIMRVGDRPTHHDQIPRSGPEKLAFEMAPTGKPA